MQLSNKQAPWKVPAIVSDIELQIEILPAFFEGVSEPWRFVQFFVNVEGQMSDKKKHFITLVV